jgi:hypothetical protein
MVLALLWLTVSTPFVFSSQQQLANQCKIAGTNAPYSGSEEETGNPLSNTNEEKNPNSTSFSEEYLHNHHQDNHFSLSNLQFHKCLDADIYIAFHGELLVPPPNAA